MDYSSQMEIINAEQMDMLIASAGVETAKTILDAFWKSNDEIVAAMTAHLDSANFVEAAASGHALKGSAANLGAVQLSERAKTIENACRAQDIVSAKAAFGKVVSDIEATRRAFDSLLMTKAA
ncbi:Hpt domain-containing protein [Aquisalinus flavus]|uniref:HPt domain-containing protein n=1 Tax=Aquisalinus flavus TaxID=1526572 RepID=A0A8J2V2D5_9PROT|nr:Hpt domain-containing protein [Aquisalinus flavus]MBD0427499.1 Hpt domain-containing protein [Aquisalinus flavus]UNE47294.1 Hpt domain-containing protein [Aquisalinus flavus]GGD01477.1 hypothetical protein GCM10011342_08120 [Aquisalinus flavus]